MDDNKVLSMHDYMVEDYKNKTNKQTYEEEKTYTDSIPTAGIATVLKEAYKDNTMVNSRSDSILSLGEEIDNLYQQVVSAYDKIADMMCFQNFFKYRDTYGYDVSVKWLKGEDYSYFNESFIGGIHASSIGGGVNGRYLNDGFVGNFALLKDIIEYSISYKKQNDDFYFDIGSVANLIRDGWGCEIYGQNPAYNNLVEIYNNLDMLMADTNEMFSKIFTTLLSNNLELINRALESSKKATSAIVGPEDEYASGDLYKRMKSISKMEEWSSAEFDKYRGLNGVDSLRSNYQEKFAHLINLLQELKTKITNFDISWLNSETDSSYYMTKDGANGSNSNTLFADLSLMSKAKSILENKYSSLTIPNTELLEQYISSNLNKGLSGSGVSDSVLNLNQSTNNIKDKFLSLIDGLNKATQQVTSLENKVDINSMALEVIRGDWGNGQARKTALEEAGYNYREIQDRVNAILLGTGAVVTNSVTNSAVSNITNNNSSDSNPGGNVQYRVDDTSNTVLDDKNKEYLDALRKAEADGEAKLKKLKEEYANKYKQLTDEQTKKIEQLKKEQEDALRKLKEEQQKKLQEMEQQLKDKEAEMAKIKAEQAAALEKLKKEQAEALKKQLEEQAKELDALKDKHAQEIEKIKQETADAIAKIKNEQKSTNTITNGSSNNGKIPLSNKPSSNGSNSVTIVAYNCNTNYSSTNNDSIVISDNNSNSVSDKPERPSYTTITTNPVTKTNSKSSNAGVVGTILGIGALGAAGAVGARYIKKKKENEIYDDNENYFSNDEEFSQSTEKDTNESTPRYEAGSVNGLVLDDDSDINITNTKSISNDTLDFE